MRLVALMAPCVALLLPVGYASEVPEVAQAKFACGDGALNLAAGEECDDGNSVGSDGCEADCKLPRGPATQLETYAFTSDGRPAQGTLLQSTSYSIPVFAIGDAIVTRSITSNSYQLSASLALSYPSPGEVAPDCGGSVDAACLRFVDGQTMVWPPDLAGVYNLYRGPVSEIAPNFGSCLLSSLTGISAVDLALPAEGEAFFYLVTAENRRGEEGTKGTTGAGEERPNPASCP